MPELPEVQAVRAAIEPKLLGKVVRSAQLLRRDVLIMPADSPTSFRRRRSRDSDAFTPVPDAALLVGATITRVHRHGKQLAIVARTANGTARALGIHLGMSGHLDFLDDGASLKESPGQNHRHVHARWTFDAGSLVFSDPRRFGCLRVFDGAADLEAALSELGPDGLNATGPTLKQALGNSMRAIKPCLLDQSVLAGVGNIYADEALFAAGIHPRTQASMLSEQECERLASEITRILRAASDAGGSTVRTYRGACGETGNYQRLLRVYDRGGEPCMNCSTTLNRALLAQRTTVWCPRCQPEHRG